MNILAINFDFNWFLTVPGMLITGGVLLLLIALIIFIATAGTGKKKEKNKKSVESLVEPNQQNNGINQGFQSPTGPVTNANTEVSSVPVNEVSPNVVPEVQPIKEVTNDNIAISGIEPIQNTPIEPVTDDNNEVSVPVNEVSPNVVPEVQPIQEMTNNNVNEQVVESAAQVISEQQPKEPAVSIYGGVSPIIPDIDTGATERPIYGGANPMDATQTIPIIQPQPHVEYGVPVEDAKVEISKETIPNNPVDSIANFQPIANPEPIKVEEVAVEPTPVEPIVQPQPEVASQESKAEIPPVTEQPKPEKKEPEIEILDF